MVSHHVLIFDLKYSILVLIIENVNYNNIRM
jgi:hypothetical protein